MPRRRGERQSHFDEDMKSDYRVCITELAACLFLHRRAKTGRRVSHKRDLDR